MLSDASLAALLAITAADLARSPVAPAIMKGFS
jgi:hypothetical protein